MGALMGGDDGLPKDCEQCGAPWGWDLAECVVAEVRRAAKNVFGCNYTFADDDIHQMAALAIRALRAGLTDGIHPDTMKEIEKRRAVDWAQADD